MNNVWFGSDYHLGHANILEYTKRGQVFTSIEEHDQIVTENHNMAVKPNDDVFFIGDLCLHQNKWDRAKAIDALNGRKHLVIGNHDRDTVQFYRDSGLFAEVETMLDLKYNKKYIVMCHYPVAYWLLADKGAWMLHGHFHGDYPYAEYNLDKYRMLDVGLDALADTRMTDWDGTAPREHCPGLYRPIHFDTIIKYFDAMGRVSMPKRHTGEAT